MASKLSKAVRDTLRDRIQDETYGINARIHNIREDYDLPEVPSFDFGADSRQFIQSAISPAVLDEAGYNNYPRLLLYATAGEQMNLRKGTLFSGHVLLTLEYHVSEPRGAPPEKMDEKLDLLEDATVLMLDDLDRQDWNDYSPPGTFVGWNANFTVSRSTVEVSGEYWLQILRFLLRFEVDVTSY